MRLCLQVFTCRKNKESEKLISRKEDNIKLVEIDVEITKIDSFLKDDKKLHDHIVAQMTERAIENNQEMKVLSESNYFLK
jgi:hypothetical protein